MRLQGQAFEKWVFRKGGRRYRDCGIDLIPSRYTASIADTDTEFLLEMSRSWNNCVILPLAIDYDHGATQNKHIFSLTNDNAKQFNRIEITKQFPFATQKEQNKKKATS